MKQIKRPLDFCAIDFETSCPNHASACAVGLVRVRNDQVFETFYTLIKPPEGMDIIPLFTNIHGITMKDVENAPDFGIIWPEIRDFIGRDFLIAHNFSFDRSVLEQCLEYYGIEHPVPQFECTVHCSRRKWPDLENHKLDTVSKFLGIDLVHHEALSDAIACAKIYLEANA